MLVSATISFCLLHIAVVCVTPSAYMQGVTDSEAPKTPKAAVKAAVKAARPSPASLSPAAQEALRMQKRACSRTLLLCDFDKTLTDFDAGELLPCVKKHTLLWTPACDCSLPW